MLPMTLEDGIRCVWDGFRKRVSFEALMFRPFTPSIIAFQLTGLLALLVCALYLCLCCGKPGLRAEQLYVINPGCARQLEEEWSAIQVVSQRTRLGGANACFVHCGRNEPARAPTTSPALPLSCSSSSLAPSSSTSILVRRRCYFRLYICFQIPNLLRSSSITSHCVRRCSYTSIVTGPS
jgi:hypothetical protein